MFEFVFLVPLLLPIVPVELVVLEPVTGTALGLKEDLLVLFVRGNPFDDVPKSVNDFARLG